MKDSTLYLKEISKYVELFLYDIDFTLLIPHFNEEDEFFRSIMDLESAMRFEKEREKLIYAYEREHKRYDIDSLSDWFIFNGYDLTPKLINEWIHFCGDVMGSDIPDGVYEHMESVKSLDKKQAISSNWFWYSQVNRLKREYLYDYFNTIVTGDMFLKPHKESYDYARGNIPRGRCLMIGDDLEKDFEVPISLGFKAILIDEDFSFRDLIGGKIDDRGSKTKVRKRFE